MRPIQIDDNFTLGQLKTFTLGESSLPIDELLELVRTENRSIPVSAYEKLMQLYDELVVECQNSNDENLKSIKFPTFKKVTEFIKDFDFLLSFMIRMYKTVRELATNQHLQEFFKQCFEFFSDDN